MAQDNITHFGIQFKPMVPSKFFGSGSETSEVDVLGVEFTPRMGFNFGMFIRRSITSKISLESGICLVNRNYFVDFFHPEITEKKRIDFRFVGYEIPIQGLVFVRLGEKLWMNGSGGFSIDMYPSNVESQTFERQDSIVYDFQQKTWRNGWLQFSVLANYGFEYRTKESGSFYLGASYHRPFNSIAITRATFKKENYATVIDYELSGSYLTLDLRYMFAEDSDKRRSLPN